MTTIQVCFTFEFEKGHLFLFFLRYSTKQSVSPNYIGSPSLPPVHTEYRKAAATIRKANAQRQRAELFRHASPQNYSDNADTDALLRERGALRGSMAGAANTLG